MNEYNFFDLQEDYYYPHSFLQDALWHSLHYITEPIVKYWPFSKLRGRSLDRVVELMRYESEETRYMTIGCVEKVRYQIEEKHQI